MEYALLQDVNKSEKQKKNINITTFHWTFEKWLSGNLSFEYVRKGIFITKRKTHIAGGFKIDAFGGEYTRAVLKKF